MGSPWPKRGTLKARVASGPVEREPTKNWEPDSKNKQRGNGVELVEQIDFAGIVFWRQARPLWAFYSRVVARAATPEASGAATQWGLGNGRAE